jgi:soluble lytic murein transglycosylase
MILLFSALVTLALWPELARAAQPDALSKYPQLADYAAYDAALKASENRDYSTVLELAARVLRYDPISPLAGRSAILAARAHIATGAPGQAAALLRAHALLIPQPEGTQALAEALDAAADGAAAAVAYQKIYYEYPLSEPASAAAAALERLRQTLGDRYPPELPQNMLERASRLIQGRNYSPARRELMALIANAGGKERDIARVRLGVCDYSAGNASGAYRYLASLEVRSDEADAERLHYMAVSARRTGDEGAMNEAVAELGRKYERSPWRLRALITAGNEYLLTDRRQSYEAVYRACAEAFPEHSQAAYCHWKIAFGSYLRRAPDALQLMREHLELYPASEKANTAIYFLGRLTGEPSFYAAVATRYPNSFYALLARERLNGHAAPLPVNDLLTSINFPERPRVLDFTATAAAKLRLERARLLDSAGFEDRADSELRFAARQGEQSHVLALGLARMQSRRGEPDDAIRTIKALVPAYLWLDYTTVPAEFWRLAFPLPYRQSVERHAAANKLDPFLVAGLIRQESEFNAGAISRAGAYGLMQVMPSTGRQLARRLRIRRFSSRMLLQPEVNIRLGTMYLRQMLTLHDGDMHATLSSYNAGKSRTDSWMTWANYREPAEFIENVPFTETRNYIQSVLRNADFYRRLYTEAAVAATESKPSQKASSKPAAKAKSTTKSKPRSGASSKKSSKRRR